jgi:site-specific recombinase XerD
MELADYWNHELKDAEQRELALSENVLKQMRKWRESHPTNKLILGRRGGRQDLPDGHLLRRLKGLVKRAGLDEKEWFLHRFRSTYCTTLLRSGMDLRTVQRLMGHEDLASTMRYLRPAGTEEVQTRVNTIQWR